MVGVGALTAGQACDRTSAALACALGIDREEFPGDRIGFVADPGGFAARLRTALGAQK
jgi:hypothetical protein